MSDTTLARLSESLVDRYRFERELGQGGMATVYLAHDLKHERDVAIKVLHPDLGAALGGERFLSEIKTTAKLQHPHILPLLDSGAADGLLFYVMPVVTGETLRTRLARERQLPIPDAVRIAREVASALDYAHRQGIVHRDIKPENILLHEGQALVADFGIALAVQSAGGQRMTQTGLSLGTPQYMSPEQAMGEKTIDARADVYALGAVTYEMLTGDPPFTGSTVQAIVAKVLSADAERPSMIRKTIPPNVEGAVLTALAKLPADRFATAAEFAKALVNTQYTRLGGTGADVAGARAPRAGRLVVLGVGAVSLIALGAAAWNALRPQPVAPVMRFDITVGPVPIFASSDLEISPDGSMLAYAGAVGGGARAIYLRNLDGAADFRLLPGTETGVTPSFSPDNQWIVFRRSSDPSLVRVSVSGGAVSTILKSATAFNPHWGTDDKIIYTGPPGTFIVPVAGGTPVPVPGLTGRRAFLLPDGSGALGTANGNVVVHDFATDSTKVLVPTARLASYAASGHLLYVAEEGGLFGMAFDLKRHAVTGNPVRLLDRVSASLSSRGYAVSSNGTLIHHDGVASGANSLGSTRLVMPRFGGPTDSIPLTTARRITPRFSPDGRLLAYGLLTARGSGEIDLYTYDIVTGTNTQLTFHGDNRDPIWSPDGKRILYSKDSANAGRHLHVKAADNSGADQLMLTMPGSQVPTGWPREDLILLTVANAAGQSDIASWSPKGEGKPQPYLAAPWFEDALTISPDGKLAAFLSRESGNDDVWLRDFPTPNGKWKVTPSGGSHPRWSRDGQFVYFWKTGQPFDSLFRARVDRTPAVVVRAPELMAAIDASGLANWDLHPDGKRFILSVPEMLAVAAPGAAGTPPSRFVVVLNWFTEVRALVKKGNK